MEMGRQTPKGIQRTQRKDSKSTSSFFTKKGRKIPSGNGYFKSCYRRGIIPRTRWKVKTNSLSIKNDATCGKKL